MNSEEKTTAAILLGTLGFTGLIIYGAMFGCDINDFKWELGCRLRDLHWDIERYEKKKPEEWTKKAIIIAKSMVSIRKDYYINSERVAKKVALSVLRKKAIEEYGAEIDVTSLSL